MEFFTVNEIAERLKVHPATVKRWLREGRLGGVPLGDRAGWRITEADLRAFLDRQREQGSKASA
jgi:excisionase family DNA binding protein